jgi:hypothetical protein
MEHVAGGSLADRLQAGDELPPGDGARIGADVAGALTALHAAGIVHRDVTPSNILLPSEGGARLADFGIARTWDGSALEDVTLTGDLVGTLRFVAPEVLAGEPAGPAADVWALGAVLYEAVTGNRPFDASSPAALLASQRTMPPMDRVDAGIAPLLGRMLDPDPTGRPAASEVAATLGRIAGDVAVVDGDAIPDEGTVVMATAVPSRAMGAVVEPVAIGSTPPVDPGPRSAKHTASDGSRAAAVLAAPAAAPSRSRTASRRGTGLPAPAVLAVGLVLLAAVVLGATAFGRPRTGEEPSPPAVTVEATPGPSDAAPTATTDAGAGAGNGGDKPKDDDKGKGKGKGNGNGNGQGKGD